MTVVIFLGVLFVLILVHELGHFVVAKWTKMRVDEFAIGFPPRLFAIKRGETEYSLNALPIGGYVKIWGEDGSNSSDLDKETRSRAFGARPRLAQAAVLIAGVVMNVLAAWLIFFAVAMIGTPSVVSEEEAGPGAAMTVTYTLPDSPASSIPLGSEITKVTSDLGDLEDMRPVAFTAFIAQSNGPIIIGYEHKGRAGEVEVIPTTGVIVEEPERAAIGISTAMVERVRIPAGEALWQASDRTVRSLVLITVSIASLLASAFTFSADLSQVTGPIGIAGMVGDAAEFGFVSLLIFTAFISLNLAVINLLPIPALDGGRLIFVLIESIIRRPIDPEWMARVNLAGFALLMLLMLAVTYNDIVKFL